MKYKLSIIACVLALSGCTALYEANDKSAKYLGEGAKHWCENVVPYIPDGQRDAWVDLANAHARPHVIQKVNCWGADL